MSRYGIASVSWIIGMLVLAPLAALPFGGQARELGPNMDLSAVHASFWGESSYDYAGYSVAIAGDVNGDGYDDVLIGAYGDDDGGSLAGQVYLFFGRASGLKMDMDCSNADASFRGEDAYDYAGRSVAGAGDVNGDGYDDILIGAPYDDDAHLYDSGQVYLVFGKASGWAMDTDLSAADASFFGEEAYDYAGWSVSGAGDVNGDGYDDILIGAYGNSEVATYAGQTYLILGKSSGWSMDTDLSGASASFRGEGVVDYSGYGVGGAGDVNRDGYADMLIGAPENSDAHSYAGQTYLILGKRSGWAMDTGLGSSSASFLGEDAFDESGASVTGAGDVNGDGYDDILVGSPFDDDTGGSAGQTYLILGKSTGWSMNTDLSASSASFRGEDSGDYSGYSVSGAGDINGDGFDDILIGAYGDDDGGSYAGHAYVILGRASGWAMDRDLSTAEVSFIGESTSDYAGRSVSGGGDVNGDGYCDLVIGAYGDDDGGTSAGQTYLVMPYALPPAPTGLAASLASASPQITLSWDAAGSWNEPVTGYRVYRSSDGSHYTDVAFRGPGDRGYIDTNVSYGRTYYYIVVTVDADGSSSYGTATLSLVCDRDTDGDGIGDMADWDDDGDGVVDGSDAFPLDSGETLDTDLDGTGNNADTDDDNDGVPDGSDARPLDPVNGLWDDIRFVNTTLRSVQTTVNGIQAALAVLSADIATLSTDLAGVNASLTRSLNDLGATLRQDLSGLNATVQAEISSAQSALSTDIASVWDLLGQVSSDLDGMNASLANDLAGVEARLAADLAALSAALEAVNASLHGELSALDADIAGFRQMAEENLTEILGRLDRQDADMAAHAADIEAMLDGLNETSLAGMKQLMDELQTRTDLLDANLSARVAEFRDKTMQRLDNVTSLMATMESINALSNEVKLVQGQAKDIQKEQDNTSQKVGDLAMPAWGAMAMIIIVLVLAILLLLGSRKKGEAAQVVEMEPPGSPPPIEPSSHPPATQHMKPVPPPEGGKFEP